MTTERTLSCGKKPIRVIIDDTGIWLAASDLFTAANRRTDRGILACFAPEHLKLLTFQSETGPIRLTAVSPLGAATIAKYLNATHSLSRIIDAWVRRETGTLADEFGFPRLAMTLLADGSFPVRPQARSDAYEAWDLLTHLHSVERKRPRDPYNPALYDEDKSVPPHDPDRDRAAFEALMAQGERILAEDPALASKIDEMTGARYGDTPALTA